MARTARQIITVSPPNLDKTGFLSLENGLGGREGPVSRDWLIDRFNDGLQVRMLREPRRGFIEFAPARASWWPLVEMGNSVVVQRLRVDEATDPGDAAVLLLREAEDWARYYGFWAVLVLTGHGVDPGTEADIQSCGYTVVDETEGGVLLRAHVLQGPMALPRLPRDWGMRTAALGSGLVIQTTGHCVDQTARGEALLAWSRAQGLSARMERLETAREARDRLAAPGTLFCVVLDGEVIDTGGRSAEAVWQEIRRRTEI